MDGTLNLSRLRLSLRLKLVIGFALISAFVAGITARGLYTTLSQQVFQEFQNRVLNAVSLAALQQNGDEFEQIASAADPLYEKFRVQNLKIRESDPQFAYVFTVSKDQDDLYFKVDAGEPGEENIAAFGERYEKRTKFFIDQYDTMTGAIVEPATYTDEYGTFLSAYAPIFNTDGMRVGAIGIDIRDTTIREKQAQLLVQSVWVAIIGTLLGIAFGYVAGSLLSDPIQKLTSGTKKFSAGDLSYRIALRTGDEVEDLGNAFNSMANDLQALINNLEARVTTRTDELAHRTETLERLSAASQERARKLRAISEVARNITQVQNLDRLLPAIVNVVSQEFNYYHVGVFLNDDANEYAVLRAANSEGGRRMLARGHRLKIGQVGLVGDAAALGKSRLASDTGSDAVFFNNPDLPDTHSEIAIPLRAGRDVIGVLDVQSDETAAFSQEDIELLGILADQISTALQNARLFAETQRALRESESATRQYVKQQWGEFVSKNEIAGVQYNGYDVITLAEPVREVITEIRASRERVTIPIRLRNEVIGTINIRDESKAEWTEDEVDIIEATAERVALALENARLLQDSQRRAAKEQTIGQITARIGASIDLRSLLQTAVEELGRTLPGSDVVVQLQSVDQIDQSTNDGPTA